MYYVQTPSKLVVLLSQQKTDYENLGIKVDVWKLNFSPSCCLFTVVME